MKDDDISRFSFNEMKAQKKYVVITILDKIVDEFPKEVLEWAQRTFHVVGGDLRQDGPDDWWLEDAEYEYS